MSAPLPTAVAGQIVGRTRVVEGLAHLPALDDLLNEQRPVIFRGLVKDWPLASAGRESSQAAIDYLKHFDAGRPVVGFSGAPGIGGRFFYQDDLAAMNFQAQRVPLGAYLDTIAAWIGAADAPSFYVGSTDLDTYLPGLRAENDLTLPEPPAGVEPPLVSIWIGNRTTAATHFDMSNNLACCLVGRRRFTLFPPDQVENLYPGPLEPTPGGQVLSLVDPSAPDLTRFPLYAKAAEVAEIAELEPGDVLFYPALWWHNVEALDAFNAMVNYWWNPAPAFMDPPMTTLLHGMLSLRDRPDAEKQAWRALFDYYVFGDPGRPGEHLPPEARGELARMDEMSSRRLRAKVIQKLNR